MTWLVVAGVVLAGLGSAAWLYWHAPVIHLPAEPPTAVSNSQRPGRHMPGMAPGASWQVDPREQTTVIDWAAIRAGKVEPEKGEQ